MVSSKYYQRLPDEQDEPMPRYPSSGVPPTSPCLSNRSVSLASVASQASVTKMLGKGLAAIGGGLGILSRVWRRGSRRSKRVKDQSQSPSSSDAPKVSKPAPSLAVQRLRSFFNIDTLVHTADLMKDKRSFMVLRGNRKRPAIIVRQISQRNLQEDIMLMVTATEGDWSYGVPSRYNAHVENESPAQDPRFLNIYSLPCYVYPVVEVEEIVEEEAHEEEAHEEEAQDAVMEMAPQRGRSLHRSQGPDISQSLLVRRRSKLSERARMEGSAISGAGAARHPGKLGVRVRK